VLGRVDFRGSFDFLSLSFSCSLYFDFELFFALFLGVPLFVPFVGLVAFPSSRSPF
jgi:hypothetical protein